MTWWIWLLMAVWWISGVIGVYNVAIDFIRMGDIAMGLFGFMFFPVMLGPLTFVANKIDCGDWLGRN